MTSCDRGLINDGRLADCLPCLKIRDIRLVFVSSAAYTTVKQKPAPNLSKNKQASVSLLVSHEMMMRTSSNYIYFNRYSGIGDQQNSRPSNIIFCQSQISTIISSINKIAFVNCK